MCITLPSSFNNTAFAGTPPPPALLGYDSDECYNIQVTRDKRAVFCLCALTFCAFQLSRHCGEGRLLLVPRERGVPTAKLGRVGVTLFSLPDPCRQTRESGAINYTEVQYHQEC